MVAVQKKDLLLSVDVPSGHKVEVGAVLLQVVADPGVYLTDPFVCLLSLENLLNIRFAIYLHVKGERQKLGQHMESPGSKCDASAKPVLP